MLGMASAFHSLPCLRSWCWPHPEAALIMNVAQTRILDKLKLVLSPDLVGSSPPVQIVDVVKPERERLDACMVFPSMPAVMKLNKLGTFSMDQLGQSKSAIAQFMRSSMKKARETNENYEEGLLKLVRTLPTVRLSRG